MSDINVPEYKDDNEGDQPVDDAQDEPRGDRAPGEGPDPIGPGRLPPPPD